MSGLGDQEKCLGRWVSAGGYVRRELLPGGRYDEARGGRPGTYHGRYWPIGDHIDYLDDTRIIADGGMVFHREE
jgi:hypothetical protein